MERLTKILTFAFLCCLASSSYAAGDYIWEAKFKKELPKAEAGDIDAQYKVGEMYEKGRGAERDLKKAFEWYNKAADKGDEKAQYKVGLAYMTGNGVGKNDKRAFEWFKKSADKGYVRSQYYLGSLYENGDGVLEDLDEATKWYKRALAGGYSNASEGLKRVAEKEKERDEARRRAERRAEAAKARPAPKPVSVPKTEKQKSPVEVIMAGGWMRGDEPSDVLPSKLTKCKSESARIECDSDESTRNIGMADINYTTKAIVFGIKPSGEFKISYRNNVTKITVTDPEFAESGGKVPVKLGWQDAEHKLACIIEDDDNIICTKNKTRTIKLSRK